MKTKSQYIITTHDGQKYNIMTSLGEAKRIAREISRVGERRLWWQTWDDDTIIGDYTRGYDGVNPVVAIREHREHREQPLP
jgi:hypothetical protein